MRKDKCYPSMKTKDTNRKNVLQYNKFIEYLKIRNYGVSTGAIADYTNLVTTFTAMFWELDCHHHTLETRGFNLPKEFESFLGLNNPKAHGHSVPLFQPLKFSTYVVKIYKLLDRNYMDNNKMKRLKANIEKTLQAVTNYVDYLETQRYQNETAHKKDHVNQEESIENFIVSDLKIYLGDDTWAQRFRPTLNALNKSEFYTPINLNNLLEYSSAQQIYAYVKHIKEKGFPFPCKFKIKHFHLASAGPHPAVHILWKQPIEDANNNPKELQLIAKIRQKSKLFIRKSSRRDIKSKLLCLGVSKPSTAEYLMREILGDSSAEAQC